MIRLVVVSVVTKLGKFRLSLLAGLTLLGATYLGGLVTPRANALNGNESKKFAKVWDGYSYAGAYDCPDFKIPAHGVAVQTFPSSFADEKCYVFHLPVEAQDGPESLVAHFRTSDIELIRYPRSSKDLVYPIAGGPLFRIDFRLNRTPGSILAIQGNHRQAPSAGQWKPNDYVLVFKKR